MSDVRQVGREDRATPLAAEGGARRAAVGGIVPAPHLLDMERLRD